MKPICLSLILYLLCSLSGHTNPPENAEAVLIEEIVLQEDQQQLKAQLNEKNKKEVTLIGQVRATSIPTQKDAKVVQVVWTALQGKDKKRVLFKEPLISTFKSGKGSLSKGLKISLYGNKAHLLDALTRLEKGEDDQISEIKADNPSSNERRLEDVEGKIKQRRSSRNLNALAASSEENSSHNNTSLSASTESYKGSSSFSSGEGKSAASLIRKPSHSQNQLSTRGMGSSLRGRTSGLGAHLKGDSYLPTHSQATTQKLNPLHGLKGRLEEDFDPSKSGQEREQSPSRYLLDPSGTGSSSTHNPSSDFEESLDKDFNPLKMNTIEGLEGDHFKMPHIEVEITKEGCRPTIDLKRGKVIVQTRSMTRKDGVLVAETPCADSDLTFDIKKDYGCCSDKIDESQRVAYTTFRRYYLDEGYNKVYLDAECIKDETQPHPFIEEKGNCRYEIDLPSRLAYPRCETVYYDRSNARKVVKGCHRSDAQPLPIISTGEGCPLKHVYEKNKSFIQKKEVFVDNGIVHEVVPCHETEESIPHQFVKSGCKPLISGSQVTPMAKRQVIYKGKKKIINDQCEPQDLTQLQSTKVGCEGQYEHDFNSGRSYPLARHYYYWGGKNRFIDKICRRSNQALDHLHETIGYEHIDSELKSKPRYQILIHDQKKKHILQEITENNKDKWIPYTLKETVERPSQLKVPTSQGSNITFAIDKIELWARPDGSLFEKVIGTDASTNISITPNDGSGKTIVSVTEEIIYTSGSGKTKQQKVRKVIRYSDGSIDYGRPFNRLSPYYPGGVVEHGVFSRPDFYFNCNE